MQLPPVTGVNVRYIGQAALGTTTWYYWVQAIYDAGVATLSSPGNTGAKAPAALSSSAFNQVQWNPAPGAIGYIVWRATASTTPGTGSLILVTLTSETGIKDDGSYATTASTPRYDGIFVAKAVYNFAVDGGGAPGLITPALSDSIPANAIVIGATINVPTAILAAGGAATISVGTSAGSSAASILAATAKASWSIDAILTFLAGTGPFGAAAFKMTAAGQITLTSATNALTAGVAEIFVYYVIAANA